MCAKPVSPEVFAKLELTVRQFLDQGMPFSAYNVTVATRDREKMHLRHETLQGDLVNEGVIHTICHLRDAIDIGWTNPQSETTRWTRSIYDLNNGPVAQPGVGVWFWVYHPEGYDLNQFKPYSNQQLASIAGKLPGPSPAAAVNPPVDASPGLGSMAVLPAKPDSGGEQDDGTFSTDYRNRLLIPTRFLRTAGIEAGKEISVVTDSANKLIVLVADSTNFQGSDVKITTQRVEKWGDLRLSSATLSPLGGEKFKIENDQQQSTSIVKVEPAN